MAQCNKCGIPIAFPAYTPDGVTYWVYTPDSRQGMCGKCATKRDREWSKRKMVRGVRCNTVSRKK